jgi:SPP1 gp7 family putative phage head morphogenesis protein
MRKTRTAEARYVAGLRGILRGVHALYEDHWTESRLETEVSQRVRHDAADQVEALLIHALRQIPAKVAPHFDKMAGTVNAANARCLAKVLPPAPVRKDGGRRDAGDPRGVAVQISEAREDNIQLVEDATRAYAADVREIFGDPDNAGLRVEELRDLLIERGNVSESRAALIARDQTLKLNGSINRVRQTAAGVESYVWSTSGDERVRETHQEQDGETYDWDSPPPETGHPGQDYQCRCVPVPVIPELDDSDADAADLATPPTELDTGE